VRRSFSYLEADEPQQAAAAGDRRPGRLCCSFVCILLPQKFAETPADDGNLRIKAALRRTRSTNHNQVFNGLLLLTYSTERLNSSL
jgi:hypothetical protein